jgi:phosphoglycolate phosphatase
MALIVFDLDGTLVDSRRDLAESANEMLAAYGAPPLSVAAVTGMVGEGARVLVQRVLKASGLDPDRPGGLDDFLRIYDHHLTVHTRVYPHVRSALEAVANRAVLAVLTNKPGAHTRKLLDALALTGFFAGGIVGGDAPWPRKPDPGGLLHLVQEAGVDPAHALMVGDSMTDVETARRAGVRMCLARYGFGELHAEVLNDPSVSVADTSADLESRLVAFIDSATP